MELYVYTTLLILIFGFLLQFKYYGAKYFLHPSFWFFLIWIFSVISFIIYMYVGFTYIIYSESLIEELFVYVSFTALSFIIVGALNYKKLRNKLVKWEPKFNEEMFRIISTAILIITLLFFFIGSGFDVVKNRENAISSGISLAKGQNYPSSLQMISSVLFGISLPMLILSGFYIGRNFYLKYSTKSNKIINKYYFYPFINAVFGTISGGGRAGIVSALIFLILGISLGIFRYNDVSTKLIFKLLKYGLIAFISFSLFSTYVIILREGGKATNANTITRWTPYPVLQPFAGLLSYLVDHYPGYQLRRVDSISPELGWGQTSLSGITMFSIPVVSQLLGTPISIQNLFNLKSPNAILSTINLQGSGAEWTNTTATVYFNLYQDFGYWGTFIAIFIFVVITQMTFNSVFRKKKDYFIAILPLTLTYYLWSQTIFSHVLLGNWMSGFIFTFLFADIISYYKKDSFKREKIKI